MRLLTAFALLLLPIQAFAYDVERATNNFAHELADCSAYYYLISEMPNLNAETKNESKKFAETLALSSAEFSNQKLALARLELATKSMTKDMDKNWANLSVVLNQYMYPCQELVQDPKKRMQYWLNKKD